jgi:hypothetical protein
MNRIVITKHYFFRSLNIDSTLFVRLMPPVVVRLHGLRAATGCGQ